MIWNCNNNHQPLGTYLWLAVSINTSNANGDLELRSRRFHFDLVYFENLERRIKYNLINPFRERLLRNSTSNPYGDFELRSRRFRFDLVYFENLARTPCHMFTILRSKFRRKRRRNETAYTRLHQIFEVDEMEMKPPTRLHQIFEVLIETANHTYWSVLCA